MDFQLRPATSDDRQALLAVYASTRADELALTGWPEAQCRAFAEMQFNAQWEHYWQHFPQSQCQLIVVSNWQDGPQQPGACLGRLWVDRGPDRLHVLDIALLPEARGQGLGTALLLSLMDEAGQRGVPLTVSVELHNPARALYERLGFVPQEAPQGIYQRMAWRSVAAHVIEHQE